MTNMVPKAAGKFDAWCQRILDAASAADDRLGLDEDYIGRMKRSLEEWRENHERHRRLREEVREVSKVRTRTRKACEKAYRACARMVQARSETTDELRDALGLTVRGRRPDRVALEDLKPPQVEVDHSERGRATIRIRQHDGRRGKPRGAFGSNVFCRFESGGQNEGEWRNIGGSSSGIFVHEIGNKEPVTVSYKASWMWQGETSLVPAAMSEPVTAAISPLEDENDSA